MQFHPTPEVPALQYVGSVEENGAASEAGLSAGDFIIEVQIKGLAHVCIYVYVHEQRTCWPGLNCISPGEKSCVEVLTCRWLIVLCALLKVAIYS